MVYNKEACKRYMDKNKEKIAKRKHEYYLKNKEYLRQYHRKYMDCYDTDILTEKQAKTKKEPRPPWPSDDFIDPQDCKELWLRVLKLAADDLGSLRKSNFGATYLWLNTSDFVEVCNLAGVDPEQTRKEFLQIAENAKNKIERKTKHFPKANYNTHIKKGNNSINKNKSQQNNNK